MQEVQIIYRNLRDLLVAFNSSKALSCILFVDYSMQVPLRLLKMMTNNNVRIVYVKSLEHVTITEVALDDHEN